MSDEKFLPPDRRLALEYGHPGCCGTPTMTDRRFRADSRWRSARALAVVPLVALTWHHCARSQELSEPARLVEMGKFFELAELQKAPVAIEAVRRIDELFAIEREINGKPPDERLRVRAERSKPLVDDLERWLKDERKKLSSKNPLAKAMDYSLKRWDAFTRFLDDGRICMSNNAAERAVRGIAVGRRNWTFCGSDAGGRRAAVMYSLIETCKLNDVDPRAWLADVLARIATHPMSRIAELMPWSWKAATSPQAQAA